MAFLIRIIGRTTLFPPRYLRRFYKYFVGVLTKLSFFLLVIVTKGAYNFLMLRFFAISQKGGCYYETWLVFAPSHLLHGADNGPVIADQPGRLQTAEHGLHVKHIFLTFTWIFSSIKCNFQDVNHQSNRFAMSNHVVFCLTLSKTIPWISILATCDTTAFPFYPNFTT